MKRQGTLNEKIHAVLATRQRRVIRGDHLTLAAILLPLFEKGRDTYVLLTKRTHKVKTHKGEISFPGGAYDQGDHTLEKTALRECFEEIGLREEDVEMLGCLDDVETLTQYMIRPFVGLLPYPYSFVVNHEEIEHMIELPLQSLLGKDPFQKKVVSVEGEERTIYTYQYGHHVIWGATAKILKQFADLVRDTS
jgi:8-oxo-dGTP pyrophosphatase MutT (NUDIX family)